MNQSRFRENLLSLVQYNLATKIVSVVIAIVLWFVVLGSRNTEVVKEVPLEVITAPDVIPSNDVPEKIAFRLSGPKAFLRAILDRREDPVRVNLAGAKPGLVTYRFFADNIRLPIGVKVLAVNPASLLFKLEPLKRREVSVKLETRGVPPEGFRVAKARLEPSTVRIRGAESKMDSVSEISTLPIDLGQLQDDLDRDVALDLARAGVQVDGPVPRVKIDLEPTSANFRIKNIDIRVLSSYKFTLEEKSVAVFVRARPQDLKSVDRSQVYATIDLRGKPKGSYRESVKVILPDKLGLVRVVPDKVTVNLY